MLFFLFFSYPVLAVPLYSIVVEKPPSCSAILYTLDPHCQRHGDPETHHASAFLWKGSLWTTHELAAAAKTITFVSESQEISAILQESAPRIGYMQFQSGIAHEEIITAKPQQGEVVRCWGYKNKKHVLSSGYVQKENVTVQYKNQQTVPLTQLSCATEPEMRGGPVTNADDQLLGMILLTGSTTYALPLERLSKPKTSLGFHVVDEVVISSTHPEIPVGSEILSISRYAKMVSPPYIQLLPTERIKVQMVTDTIWIFPLQPKYSVAALFEENNGIRQVLQPSAALHQQGLKAQDIWQDHESGFVQRIQRNTHTLYMLNPAWWRKHPPQKRPLEK